MSITSENALREELEMELRNRYPNLSQMSVLNQVRARREIAAEVIGHVETRAGQATASHARELRAAASNGREFLRALDDRIAELEQEEGMEARAAKHAAEMSAALGGSAHAYTNLRGGTYHPESREVSFFRDLRNARLGDWEAAQRLQQNERERGTESRALSTTAGAGGQFAPPAWLVEEFITLARPGRVAADQLHKEVLPGGVSSINLPKIATGTATAVQSTQNTALQQTDMTTSSVSGSIVTIGGKQVVSQQLIDQSGIPFDRVIMTDLAADYARALDVQVILGTGSSGQLPGLTTVAGTNAIAYTTASPAVTSATNANSFYSAVINAANAVHAARFLPATAVIMHPRRWAWVLEALDSSTRPLLPSAGGAFNSVGSAGGDTAQGSAGVFANLPVYLDPSIPTNLGAGTNQDQVVVLRGDDSWLYESELRMEAFDAPYADSAGVMVRALGYASLLHRFPGSISVIGGTGLVAPSL